MNNRKLSPRKRGALLVSVLSIAIVLIGIKKIFDYAAPPEKDKDCDFIYPGTDSDAARSSIVVSTTKPTLALEQQGGFINDASCLNKTPIYGVVQIRSADDVAKALEFARAQGLKVTAAGQRHSMGGQSFSMNGLVLDMKLFNKMTLDADNRILHVESGATWEQIQQFLDRRGLSVKAMQSINIFTVGGTLSVNAHGIAHNPGPVAPTVRSIRIMLSNGEIKTASRSENEDLFRHALGGYGLFGVILDADIDVVENDVYALTTEYIDYKDFPAYYTDRIRGNDSVGLFYSRLSVAPGSYLTETAVHTYTRTEPPGSIPPLQPESHDWRARLVMNLSKTGGFGRATRWWLEKHAEPHLRDCISRNQALNRDEACLVTRNQEMYDSMGYLKNRLKDTDILQEYFIPQNSMPAFADGLRSVVKNDGANLLNVTIRGVHKDDTTALPYAKQDMFAFVLYFNQKLNPQDSQVLQKTTSDLIDLATDLHGTFYLPYRLYYSKEQLRKAYPEVDGFFAAKKQYDPSILFDNAFYQKYAE